MPKPYPRQFPEDVIRVALDDEPGIRIKEVAEGFGITESCFPNWLARAGRRAGPTSAKLAELRELKNRNRLLEQESKVLRREAEKFLATRTMSSRDSWG